MRSSLVNKFIKDTSWNSFGVLTYFACQWFMTIVVVWLSDDLRNAGNLNLAMSVSNFFVSIALYNIRYFQVSDIKNEYTDSEYTASRVISCVVSVLICIVFAVVADYSPVQRLVIIFYMLFRANEAFLDVFHGIDQQRGKMDYVGISMFFRGIAMITAFIILMWLFNLLTAVIGLFAITVIVGLVYDFPRTKKLADFTSFTWKQVFSLLKRCFPLMLVLFTITTIGSYSRYSIERINGTEALGIYASVAAPTLIVQVAATPLLAPLANLFAGSIKEKNKKKFLKIFALSSVAIFGIVLVFTGLSLVAGQWGLNVLYRDRVELTQYAYLLPGAFFISGLVAYIWFMNMVFTAIRDIKGIFAGNMIGVIICVAITDYFLNRFGIEGANHVLIISQGIVVICLIIRLLWVTRKNEGFN